MIRTQLRDGWTLRAAGGPVPDEVAGAVVPATVPGSAHTDLLAAGLIPDPYLDLNENALTWAHHARWRYDLEVDIPAPAPDERIDLAFDGLDTIATIVLDGHEVAQTINMHRAYRFDVRDLLTGNQARHLTVTFDPALEWALAQREQLGARPAAYEHPIGMIRKMACSFGWDWGPDLQTAGMWKPVRVERWRLARLAQVRPLVTIDEEGTAHVAVHIDVERSGLPGSDVPLTVRAALPATLGGTTDVEVMIPAGATTAVVALAVHDAPLWWPVGYGEQPLHSLAVRLGSGSVGLDTHGCRLGFRTIDLDTTPDDVGAAFTFVVNGRPVFVKGANWIPDDHLLTRTTREDYAASVDDAVAANMNLLRVWGGGIYERDEFYDVCDERGVLVWQDFLLACAAYPEEGPLLAEIEAEARDNVARLVPHPSLALWNGGNENVWGYMDWGWKDELEGRTWGARYVYEVFPRVLAELDPTRYYSDNSPASPGHAPEDLHPNDLNHGTHHQWEVWNRQDYTMYASEVPRFCSEFGFQGPPTWATLEAAVRNDDGSALSKDDAVFLLHQKAEDGNGKLDRGMAPHLPVTDTFADWHWATQLNQARAVAFAVEHYRSWWPRTAGAIVWQLNDCWPVTSWAAVDSYGRRKPLWYALRAAYAPRLLTVQPRAGRTALVAVNDTDEPWTGTVTARRETLDGVVLGEQQLPLEVPPRSAATLGLDRSVVEADDITREVLVLMAGDVRATHTFAEDVDIAYDPAPLEAEAHAVQGGYEITVTARSFARDVTLLVDRVDPDARVDRSGVSLPAGASTTFHVRSAATLDIRALTAPEVLRCANDLRPDHPSARLGCVGTHRCDEGGRVVS